MHKVIGSGAIFASLLTMLLVQVMPAAYAQNIIDTNYSGPVFQDAFWTNRTTMLADGSSLDKVEVGPGDGASVLAVVLVNRGLSQITSITGTMDLPSGFQAATGDTQAVAKQNAIIQPGQAFTLFFEVNASNATKVGGYNAQLHVQYSRVLEVGQYRNSDIPIPFRLTGKVVLDAEAVNHEVVPGSANQVTIKISNRGTAPATGVVVTASTTTTASAAGTASLGPNNGSTPAAVIVGQKAFEVGSIAANGTTEIYPTIYVSNGAGQMPQSINIQVSYSNAYGIRSNTGIQVGLVVLPRALESDISISQGARPSAIVTAGKIHPYNFTVSNTSGKPLSNVLVTLTSTSDSIKILGDSKWTIKGMNPNYTKTFTTQVFAPTSMIGASTTFNLSLQYLSDGQTKTDSTSLGAYVDGEISVRAYDIDITYIGDTPNIVGNLLNEGNTKALFTTIQLTNTGGLTTSLPPSQYLGDLEENSPLPFSIPVDISNGTGANTYPISLKVTYKDNLRETHTFDINANIKFQPKQLSTKSQNSTINNPTFMIGIGVVVAAILAIIIATIIIRRKKKSNLKRTITERKHNDIESLLDSQQRLKTDERK